MFQVMRLRDGRALVFPGGIKRLGDCRCEEQELRIVEELDENRATSSAIACGFLKGDRFSTIAQWRLPQAGQLKYAAFRRIGRLSSGMAKKLAKPRKAWKRLYRELLNRASNIVPSANLIANKKGFVDSFAEYDKVFVIRKEAAKGRWEICSCKGAFGSFSRRGLLFIFGQRAELRQGNRRVYRGWAVCIGLGPHHEPKRHPLALRYLLWAMR